jgi:hypothetical protein
MSSNYKLQEITPGYYNVIIVPIEYEQGTFYSYNFSDAPDGEDLTYGLLKGEVKSPKESSDGSLFIIIIIIIIVVLLIIIGVVAFLVMKRRSISEEIEEEEEFGVGVEGGKSVRSGTLQMNGGLNRGFK